MKKVGKLFIVVTAMLCLFLIPGFTGFKSHAATGDLYTGYTFNNTVKAFTNSKVTWNTEDKTTKKIVFSKPLAAKKVKNWKKKTVGAGVTAYYDSKNKTIYVCCNSKIAFNKSCTTMFRGLTALETIDFGSGIIDTTKMGDVTSMFADCVKLKSIDLSALDTRNVYSMQAMFSNCKALETINFGTFNTSNVSFMNKLFYNCSKLSSLNLSMFNTSKVTDVQCMFYGCTSLIYVNLSSFNLSGVAEEEAVGFLGGCNYLVYVDAPGILDRDFSYDENPGNLGKIKIGKAYIDDNRDGYADSGERYSYFIASAGSHRYVFLDAVERVKKLKGNNFNPTMIPGYNPGVQNPAPKAPAAGAPAANPAVASSGNVFVVNGITYSIGADGCATVTKIGSVKKASINTVNIGGAVYPVTQIAASACKGNKKITSVSIGSNVKLIGKKAFYGSKRLKKVSIKANGSLKVEKEAFKKLGKKATITLKGVKGKTRKKIVKSIGVRVR